MKSETINTLGEIFVKTSSNLKKYFSKLSLPLCLSLAVSLFAGNVMAQANAKKNTNKKVSTKIDKKSQKPAAKPVEKKAETKAESKAPPVQTPAPAVAEIVADESIGEEIGELEVPLKDDSAPAQQGPPPDQTPLVTNASPQMVKMSKDKKFKINFEDELITGAQDKPELETIFSRKKMNFKKMIRLRENFINESEKGKEFFREGI